MKKIYSFILFSFLALSINAQVTVTFAVDMNEVSLDAGDKVTIGGDFQGWNPSAEVGFTDDDGDGIYIGHFALAPGQVITYKFVINDWGTNEFGEGAVAGDCNTDDGAGNINRIVTIPMDAPTFYALPTYKYDSCELSETQVNVENVATISGVKFTPNPAIQSTLISFENPTNAAHDIIITSLTGQTVNVINSVRGNTIELNVADFANGLYFVTFRNEAGEQGTEKLVVRN